MDLEWDHVMPQSLGGWNLAWNLEPSCRRCNAKKSNLLTPSSYWFKTTFVFDGGQGVDLDKFRKSQLLPYNTLLEYKDHFKDEKFLKQLFRFQLLYLATVSAGKTLSILSILFALNRIFLDIYLASPRIDKALVVTKDEDLRDQLVSELSKEPIKYGIFTNDIGLKVEAVKTRSRALQIVKKHKKDRNLTKDTIYVCCQQLLWEDKREEEVNEIIKSFLSIFRVAFFDESHWSPKQARKIQKYLPFFKLNLTGTPFDKSGKAYDHQIKIAHWGSQQAREIDGSLKMLPISPEGVVIQPKPVESEFELAGNLSIKEDKIDDHKNNIKTVITCIRSGLLRLRADDQVCKQVARDKELLKEGALSLIEFRNKYLHPDRAKYGIDSDSIPDLIYPSFMGVVVSDFNELQSIKEQFRTLVPEFPELLNHKDIISVAYGSNEEDDQEGKKRAMPSISLDERHSWMLAHNQVSLPFRYDYNLKLSSFEWQLPKQASRILLYVNKNREGCNNKYARIFVLARTLTSKKTLVQSVGRYIRGIRYVDTDGSVHVPPKQLDEPLIISHDAFQNEAALLWTWQYLQDPGSLAEEFPTLESLVVGLEPTTEQEQDSDELIIITNASKLDIAEAVGRLEAFETTGDLMHLTAPNGEIDPRFKQGSNNTSGS
ncbi:MAG: DEAD/DEAH box helicase family protein [Leptolyngbyaceae cyanobacterium SL_5_9]|nr:DEAD/DEAH box helicase family protein [Leptolyngbyaceae cyanobacterium SL_5_9]